jgi:hypothetical protein
MGAQIDLRKVDDLIEARERFFLFAEMHPDQIPELSREGKSVNEAGVVMLSAAFQTFVEIVLLECSFKAFGRELREKQLTSYQNTWKRWGNPNPGNIKILFRRLGIDDVFQGLAMVNLPKDTFLEQLDMLNSARNCIAHGSPIAHNKQSVTINLSVLREWRRIIDQGSRALRFCALHSSDL